MKRVCAFLVVCLCVSPVYATLYTFNCVTNNSLINAGTGQAQLTVDVMPTGSDVEFTFHNTGSEVSVITQIYFYGELLESLIAFDDSCPGVDFDADTTNPGHLPGYTPNPSIPIKGELTRAKQGGVNNGINQFPQGDPDAEWLSAVWSLGSGYDFMDLLDAMDNGSVMIGMHVQAFGDGGSEGFSQTPEPATLVLLGIGVLGLMVKRRT